MRIWDESVEAQVSRLHKRCIVCGVPFTMLNESPDMFLCQEHYSLKVKEDTAKWEQCNAKSASDAPGPAA